MEGTGRVFADTPSPTVSQLLDLGEDVACLVVGVDSLGIAPRQMGESIRVHLRSEWASIFESPWNLPCPALCGAVDSSSNEDHFFPLAAEGLLPSLTG